MLFIGVFNENKQLRVPKKFMLFGHEYTVVLVKDLYENEDSYGTADDELKLIKLQDLGPVMKRYEDEGKLVEIPLNITKETVIETFFHELTHIILDSLGEEQLSENERFVNMMGKAFLEVYLSSRYEEDSR